MRSTTVAKEGGYCVILPATSHLTLWISDYPPTHPEEGLGRLGRAAAGTQRPCSFPFPGTPCKSDIPMSLVLEFRQASTGVTVTVPAAAATGGVVLFCPRMFLGASVFQIRQCFCMHQGFRMCQCFCMRQGFWMRQCFCMRQGFWMRQYFVCAKDFGCAKVFVYFVGAYIFVYFTCILI